jgi:radical SAM protein with 4Fe4S-binding SPASM domain
MYQLISSDKMLDVWGPRIVEIIITNICNLRCKMCDRYRWIKDNRERLREIPLEKMQDLFSEFKEIGVKRVPLSGGEPLQRSDFIEIVESISRNGMDVTVVNNGTFMTRPAARALAEAGATMIFSLEGSVPEIHDKSRGVVGTWEKTIRGIKYGVEARREADRGEVVINFVVQSFNAADMYDAVVLADKLGVDAIRFALVHGYTTTNVSCDSPDVLSDSVRKISASEFGTDIVISPYLQWYLKGQIDPMYVKAGLPAYQLFKSDPVTCMVAYQSTLIDTWGDVYPCTYAYHDNQPATVQFDKLRTKNVLGNIYENTFKEIWTGEAYTRFRTSHAPVNIDKTSEVCGQCEHYYAFKSIEDTIQRSIDESSTLDQAVQRVREEKPCGCFSNEFEFRL